MTKKVIESVVDNCVECKFSRVYVEEGGNTSYVLMCEHNEMTSESEMIDPMKERMYLMSAYGNPKKRQNFCEIPEECPLEEYVEHEPFILTAKNVPD